MTKTIPLSLAATALALGLGAPAFAQVVDQFTPAIGSNGTTQQTDTNSADVSLPGTLVNSGADQTAGTQVNATGPAAYLGLGTTYVIQQGAGTFLTGSGTLIDPFIATNGLIFSTASNSITASNGTVPGWSTVSVAGNQTATNAVNLANIAPAPDSTGLLDQSAGLGDPFSLSATNNMAATVFNGTASVGPGSQAASDTVNTGSVSLPSGLTTLTLFQELPSLFGVTATNSAAATSTATGFSSLDPSVNGVAQSSALGTNQLGFGLGGGVTAASMDLQGFQIGFPYTFVNTGTFYVTFTGQGFDFLGNTVTATTGTGNGAAAVNGVTQSASFGLDNVLGGSGVSLALSGDGNAPATPSSGFVVPGFPNSLNSLPADLGESGGFQQVVAWDTMFVFSSLFGPEDGVINYIEASSTVGSAAITGVAGTLTQSFVNQQNSISTGYTAAGAAGTGTLSGTATQTVLGIDDTYLYPISSLPTGSGIVSLPAGSTGFGYLNVAVANVISGPASITGVSQNLAQSYNIVQGVGTGSGLNLTQQIAGFPSLLGSYNLQIATGSSSATISGASQSLNTSLNLAQLGTLSGSNSLAQTATTGLSITNTNTLAAISSRNASVGGAQLASSQLNVAQVGIISGPSTLAQTATGASLANTNTLSATSGFNASLGGNQMASSQINVIK